MASRILSLEHTVYGDPKAESADGRKGLMTLREEDNRTLKSIRRLLLALVAMSIPKSVPDLVHLVQTALNFFH